MKYTMRTDLAYITTSKIVSCLSMLIYFICCVILPLDPTCYVICLLLCDLTSAKNYSKEPKILLVLKNNMMAPESKSIVEYTKLVKVTA